MPQARLCPGQQPLNIGAMAHDHVEAAHDHQQRDRAAVAPRRRRGRSRSTPPASNPAKRSGSPPAQGRKPPPPQTHRPGQRQQHAQPGRGGFAAREIQPDRTAMPQQRGKSGQADGPGRPGLRIKRCRRRDGWQRYRAKKGKNQRANRIAPAPFSTSTRSTANAGHLPRVRRTFVAPVDLEPALGYRCPRAASPPDSPWAWPRGGRRPPIRPRSRSRMPWGHLSLPGKRRAIQSPSVFVRLASIRLWLSVEESAP